MSHSSVGSVRLFRTLEYGFALFILAMVVNALQFLAENLYLPQPFFFDASDTFTDWFYTAYYAHHPQDAYDFWATIYPPFAFIFMKLFTIGSYYDTTDPRYFGRYHDWLSYVTMASFWVLNGLVAFWVYRKRDPTTMIPRTIAVWLGLPMLFAVDRGNLVFVTYFFLFLSFGEVLQSARARWANLAIAINLKTYVLPLVVVDLIRHRFKPMLSMLLMTLALYLFSWFCFGYGSPKTLIDNTVSFSFSQSVNVWDIWYTTTYKPILSLIYGPYPIISAVGSTKTEIAEVLIPTLTVLSQVIIFAACFLCTVWRVPMSRHRAALLVYGFTLITVELLGYSSALLIFLALMEKGQGVFQRLAIIGAYLLAIPADWVINSVPPLYYEGFYAGKAISLDLGVAIGQELRPGIIMLIPTLLALESLIEAIKSRRTSVPV